VKRAGTKETKTSLQLLQTELNQLKNVPSLFDHKAKMDAQDSRRFAHVVEMKKALKDLPFDRHFKTIFDTIAKKLSQ
jgi:hypothetical protein